MMMKLNLPRRTKRRPPNRKRQPLIVVPTKNVVWALDFMRDTLYGGNVFRTLNVIDVANCQRRLNSDPLCVGVNERLLRRVIARYLDYYRGWRTHLSLSMDAPNSRTVHPQTGDRVIALPEVGGLHHYYERLAA